MQPTLFITLTVTGLGIAFLHAAIPTHWLPFVTAGRAQRWPNSKILSVTLLAGAAHVLTTAVLGVALTVFGFAVSSRWARLFPILAGAVLIGLGGYYLWQQLTTQPHSHAHASIGRGAAAERATIAGLVALLLFSPCEGFLPIYLSGVRFGWIAFAVLTVVLSIGTVVGMLLFTALALIGFRTAKLREWEHIESGATAALLILAGVLVLIFER